MIVRYTKDEYLNAKSFDKLALECERCGKIFYADKKQIKFEEKHERGRLRYCSTDCSNLAHQKRYHVHCKNCGKEIEVLQRDFNLSDTKNFFCSHSCSATYNNKKRSPISDEQKAKISNSIKKLNLNKPKRICRVCGREYSLNEYGSTRVVCSRECSNELRENRKKYLSPDIIEKLSFAGRRSAEIQSLTRRSKNEKYFFNLCEKHFKNVRHNEPIFNGWDADVIIEDIKFGILWNGKWHYEKITENHSLEQTQNRDKIKIGEIKKCGYTPYVIKDMGKYNPLFVENEFQKLLNYIHAEE